MSFVSMGFLIFVGTAVAGYYLIPKKFQWMWLLAASYVYYLSAGMKLVFFLLFTTGTTYLAGRLLEQAGNKEQDKKLIKKNKRLIVASTLILNFGVLAVLKYTNFAILNFNKLFSSDFSFVDWALPLGISFYTFQSMGYLLDVYWGRVKAEKNPFKFALFVSFFPQILQGPIGRFGRLADQFYEEHVFQLHKVEKAIYLILWGYFKKMVLADNAAVFVDAIFGNPDKYSGLAIVGVLMYSIQLYGDFSGGIDVVTGIAELFGISLDENFRRPYFARSITDFWHRWHITLGTWMKDYIFYPLSLSKGMNKFGKAAKKVFGKNIGRTLPICVSNIVVFLVVGVWHGAAWKFIAYGLFNGLIIAVSGLLAQNYKSWKKALHINDKTTPWILFCILRTFILVNISWFFDRALSVGQAVQMMKYAVTEFRPSQIMEVTIRESGNSYVILALGIIILGSIVLFIVSFLQERGMKIRESIGKRAVLIRVIVILILMFTLPVLGQPPALNGGFIYAQF